MGREEVKKRFLFLFFLNLWFRFLFFEIASSTRDDQKNDTQVCQSLKAKFEEERKRERERERIH
jgi:hypothetical protein